LGEVETLEYNRDKGLGITVFVGHRKGSASTTDFSLRAMRETVQAACSIARYAAEDPCTGLAPAPRMAWNHPDLDLYHPWDIEPEEAIEVARRCEDAARNTDARIVNSEGASFNSHRGLRVYGNSHGFIGGFASTRHSLSCSVLGEDENGLQRDHWYTSARRASDLERPEDVGVKAAQRTLNRLGARRLSTREAPVIFAAEVATSLLGHFVATIRGGALYRRASFLLDHLGKPIFPAHVRIHEQPRLVKGFGSSPFDSEGVATADQDLVSEGILRGYVLDSYSACRLGLETTGNAGGVRNLTIDPGEHNRSGLSQLMGTGLLATELMGMGVNTVTGDYSRGAAGFWIENGEVQYPVQEITVAGNLRDMFQNLVEVGSDVDTRGNIRTGSLLFKTMTVAGE
jgi:PmbA protein